MKKLAKLLTAFLTVSLLASLLPAVSLFAEEEVDSILPVQTEQVVYGEADASAVTGDAEPADTEILPAPEEIITGEPEQETAETEEQSMPSEEQTTEQTEKAADGQGEPSALNKIQPSVAILAETGEAKAEEGKTEQKADTEAAENADKKAEQKADAEAAEKADKKAEQKADAEAAEKADKKAEQKADTEAAGKAEIKAGQKTNAAAAGKAGQKENAEAADKTEKTTEKKSDKKTDQKTDKTDKEEKDKKKDESKPEEDKTPEDGRIELAPTNNTAMFKVETAYLETKDGKSVLVVALSGKGYHDLFKGTYEQAAANGANTANWIHGSVNKEDKLEFRIPVAAGETYIPVVAVSNSYYQGYLNNKNSIERAFYPRQMVLDIDAKTLVTGDYEVNQELTIVNNVRMFKPEAAQLYLVGGPNSNHYQSDLVLTMGSTSFDKACYGTKEEADSAAQYEAADGTTFTIPVRWVEEFGRPETMKTVIGTTVTMSFHSVKNDAWYERKMTIDEEAGTVTFDEVKKDEEPSDGGDTPVPAPTPTPTPTPPTPEEGGSKDSGWQDTVGGNTAAVDNSTGLADGIYTPDRFAFSGGSGRIVITCDQIEVVGGKAFATIVFQNIQSGTTEMNYVKASGGIYYCSQVGGSSVARIPVELNQNNQILALTTKMSAAHEIAYTLFIYLAGAEAQQGTALTENTQLDREAPAIAGLEYQNEEVLDKAEYFKIFNYSDGIKLLEIDMRLRENDPNSKEVKEAQEKEEAALDAGTVVDEETGEEVAVIASKAEAQAKLYKGSVVKYLLVPENTEIPAGLDKETIVVQLPLKSVYSGSDAISGIFEKLAIKDRIKSQAKEDKKNKDIVAAGEFKDLALKKLIKSKCDLVLLPEDSIKDKKAREIFAEKTEDLANLDIPVIVDRSEYEESDEAKAEWLKVYGLLFGCEEAANAAMQAAKN